MKHLDLPHTGEPKMSQFASNVLAVAAGLALVAVALLLSACATWTDYAAEIRNVNEKIAGDRKAAADRDAREEASYLSAMTGAQSDVARVAMAGFWALAKAKGGSVKEGPGYVAPVPPPDPADSLVKLATVTVPVLGTVGAAAIQAASANHQSDNAARTAASTNAAMVALGTTGAQVAGNVATTALAQLPNLRPMNIFSVGRDGVIGDGTFTSTVTTQTLTTGNDGVLGPGSITRPANPSRVCTVSATGVVMCQ